MIRFSYPTKDLLRLLRQLKSPVSVSRYDAHFMRCELIVLPSKVIFKLPGNEVYLNVQPIGYCKAEIYFKDVYDVLRTMEEKEVSVFIQGKTIKLNEVTLSAKIEQFTKGSIQQQVELPMDFLNEDSNDLFTQKIVKSKDYQSKDGSRHYSEYEISKDIEDVHARLKKYNIEYRMIEQFVKCNLMRV